MFVEWFCVLLSATPSIKSLTHVERNTHKPTVIGTILLSIHRYFLYNKDNFCIQPKYLSNRLTFRSIDEVLLDLCPPTMTYSFLTGKQTRRLSCLLHFHPVLANLPGAVDSTVVSNRQDEMKLLQNFDLEPGFLICIIHN